MMLSTPLQSIESSMIANSFSRCNDNNNNVGEVKLVSSRTLPPTPPQRLHSSGPESSVDADDNKSRNKSHHHVDLSTIIYFSPPPKIPRGVKVVSSSRTTHPPTPPQRLQSVGTESSLVVDDKSNHVDLSTTIIYFSPPPKMSSRNRFSSRQSGESPILQLRECIRRNQQLNQLQSTSSCCHPNLNNSILSIDHNDTDGDRVTPCAPSQIQKQQARSVNTDSSNIVFPHIESIIQCDGKIRSNPSREKSFLLNEQTTKNPIYVDIPQKKPICYNNEEKNECNDGCGDSSYFEASVNLDFDYEVHHKSECDYRSRFNAPPRRRSTMSFSRVSSVSSITCGDYDYDDTECYEYGYGYREEPNTNTISSSLTQQPASPSPRLQVSPSTRRLSSRDFFGKHTAATQNNGGGCCMAPKAPRRRSTLHYYFPDIDENVEQEQAAVKNTNDDQ